MAYLGDKLRSEAIRFYLTLDAAPTGTPTITITRGQGTALDTPVSAVNMTMGASNLEWYYDYTTEAAAQIGIYAAKYSAVIDAVTRFAYDNYDVTVADADAIKTETASIQADTTSIETKVDTVDANVDQLLVDVAAVPTVEEIDTELTTEHGAGAWTAGSSGTGAYSVIFNVKDGSAVAQVGAYVTVHNSNDDDSPLLAWDTATDANGDTDTLNIDGAVKVRVSAANFTYTTSSHTISASGTINLVGVASTVSNPTDPDVCRLRLYPITLGNADITDLATSIKIHSQESLTKVSGQYIKNTEATFTYDSATAPDSYYFDAVRGSTVHLTCDVLGLDHDLTVPDEATKDISALQT